MVFRQNSFFASIDREIYARKHFQSYTVAIPHQGAWCHNKD